MTIREVIVGVVAEVNGVSVEQITDDTVVNLNDNAILSQFSAKVGKLSGVYIGLNGSDRNQPVKHFVELYDSLFKSYAEGGI